MYILSVAGMNKHLWSTIIGVLIVKFSRILCSKLFAGFIFVVYHHTRKIRTSIRWLCRSHCRTSSQKRSDARLWLACANCASPCLPERVQHGGGGEPCVQAGDENLHDSYNIIVVSIRARCLTVNCPIFSHRQLSNFSTNKTSKFACWITSDGKSAKSRLMGPGRCLLTDLK